MNVSIAEVEAIVAKFSSAQPVEKRSFFQRVLFRFKAKREVAKTLKALDEAKKIQQGKKQGKSFDQFLKEL